MAAPNLLQVVARLGQFKREVDALLEKMAALKDKIKPYLAAGPVEAAGAKALYVKGYETHDLKKDKMRHVLQTVLKLSPVMVDRIMLLGADKRIVGDYVKITLDKKG